MLPIFYTPCGSACSMFHLGISAWDIRFKKKNCHFPVLPAPFPVPFRFPPWMFAFGPVFATFFFIGGLASSSAPANLADANGEGGILLVPLAHWLQW